MFNFLSLRQMFFSKPEVLAILEESELLTDTQLDLKAPLANPVFTGTVGSTFTAPTFNTGWGDLGAPHATTGSKTIGDMVFVHGVVARSSGSAALIATLPAGHRPATRHLCIVMTNSGAGYVDIDPDGTITLSSGGTVFVSLNGINFSTL